MIKNHAQHYIMPQMQMFDRSLSSREGAILLLIIVALVAAVFGSIITP